MVSPHSHKDSNKDGRDTQSDPFPLSRLCLLNFHKLLLKPHDSNCHCVISISAQNSHGQFHPSLSPFLCCQGPCLYSLNHKIKQKDKNSRKGFMGNRVFDQGKRKMRERSGQGNYSVKLIFLVLTISCFFVIVLTLVTVRLSKIIDVESRTFIEALYLTFWLIQVCIIFTYLQGFKQKGL